MDLLVMPVDLFPLALHIQEPGLYVQGNLDIAYITLLIMKLALDHKVLVILFSYNIYFVLHTMPLYGYANFSFIPFVCQYSATNCSKGKPEGPNSIRARFSLYLAAIGRDLSFNNRKAFL